jgi:hypothetical protein
MPELESPPEAADQRSTTDAEEIQRLQHLVLEKDHALFRAVLSGTNVQQQLELVTAESESLKSALAEVQRPAAPGTQQDLNRQRKEWLQLQKTMEREQAQSKAELVQLRVQSYKLQQQLEIDARARRMEAAQYSSRIASLERSLSSANREISKAYANTGKSDAKRGVGIAVASVVAIMGAVAAWAQISARASAPAGPIVLETPAPATTPHLHTGAGFQNSLGRLNEALSSFGNRSPEEILREVRLHSPDHAVCAFHWNNGQPALLFGIEGVRQSLASALGSCAVAVEHYQP